MDPFPKSVSRVSAIAITEAFHTVSDARARRWRKASGAVPAQKRGNVFICRISFVFTTVVPRAASLCYLIFVNRGFGLFPA